MSPKNLLSNLARKLSYRIGSRSYAIDSRYLKEVDVKCLSTTFRMKYFEFGNTDGVTCLFLHGSPGHHDHFEQLATDLGDQGIHVLGLNWPGFDNTQSPNLGDYKHTTEDRFTYLESVVHSLGRSQVDMLVGHSLGCPVSLHAAASSSLTRSIVLLNPVCHRPHRRLMPRWKVPLTSRLLLSPLRPVLRAMQYPGWRLTGFEPETLDTYETSTHDTGNLNFTQIAEDARRVAQQDVPRIMAYTQTDKLIEHQIPEEFEELFGVPPSQRYRTDEAGVTNTAVVPEDGSFARSIQFVRGGHFAHRNKRLVDHIMDLARYLQSCDKPHTCSEG